MGGAGRKSLAVCPIKEPNRGLVILWDMQIKELPLPKYGIIDKKFKEVHKLNNQIIHINVADALC